ncbi:tetratricopeptide repeat protein [Salipiger mangrovisoli]|uniref:tetratricopeptide repeat protein n=1 Tax=Salipiger mangrovisoli TaxID=2865933 RepID=UPI001F11BBC6|nr:tetratricopeptide repeat protein [Salipiger mangrovisoli]
MKALLDYQAARQAGDDVTAGEAAERARALLDDHPDLDVALRVLVDWHGSGPEPARALPHLERLLALHPDSLGLQMARVQMLFTLDRQDELGQQLHAMHAQFPENPEVVAMVIRWHLLRDDMAGAEAFLRMRAGADDADPERHLEVVELLRRSGGPAAAQAELERLAAANEATDRARIYALRAAQLRFDAGQRHPAMEAVADVVAHAQEDDLANEARISLARMYSAEGDVPAAQALVDDVLASDETNVEGLILRAAWQIRADAFGPAITDLRLALDQAPRRTDILRLLAEAQKMLGNIELAEQRLAQAVEISNSAPREALAYARFQIERGAHEAAMRVLTEALRTSGDLQVATLLAQTLLVTGDTVAAGDLLERLAQSGQPEAEKLARAMQAELLLRENRVDESLALVAAEAAQAEDGQGAAELSTEVQLLRILMSAGRFEQASDKLAQMREAFPEATFLRLLEANLKAIEGKNEEAVTIYRALLEDAPDEVIPVQRLHALLTELGRRDEAAETLAATLERHPEARSLRVLHALDLEHDGQAEAAIEIYQALYAEEPGDIVIANNLASMLSTHSDEAADLERAYMIAQRLNGSQVPAYLDTLGWVQLRKGEVDSAVLNLQAAARGLPRVASIAFNLALAYAEAGRTAEARAELARGFELAGDDQAVPQFARAQALRDELGG